MPQRVMGAWLVVVGLVGLAAVGVLALCGRDVRAAARRGPRWKRRLLAAGLSVLAAFGWTGRSGEAREPTAVATVSESKTGSADASEIVLAVFRMRAQLAELEKLTAARDVNGPAVTSTADAIESLVAVLRAPGNVGKLTPKGQAEAARLLALARKRLPAARALVPVGTTDLVKSPQWQVVADAWRFAGPLAVNGKSTSAQRKEADAKLKAAAKAVSALQLAGLLTSAEAGLLTVDAARIRTEIYRNPPTDFRGTCYDMAYIPPAQASLGRLQKQVAYLKTIVGSDKLAPAALDKVIGSIERDVAILADPKQTKRLPAAQKAGAEALRKQVSLLAAQIKRRVLSARLGQTAGWATVTDAMAFGAKIGQRNTTAQRKQFTGKLTAAVAALAALAKADALTEGESTLMSGELQRIRTAVTRYPPTDIRVTCYKMAYNPPAKRSFERLQKRLPLLKKLAESGRLNTAVLAKVLPTVRADIETLSREKELAQLRKDRALAEAVRKQAAPVLAAIEKQLASAGAGK